MTPAVLLRYVGRRIAGAILVLVVVSIVIFLLVHLAPGGPERAIGGINATPQQLAGIRAKYGLDDSLPVQWWRYARGVVHLDLGSSLLQRESVATAIGDGLQVTAPLVLASALLICLIGVALGTLAAYRSGGILDRAVLGASAVGASAPPFVTAIILMTLFGVQLHWFPTLGDGEGFADRVRHLVLPVLTLTTLGVAAMLHVTRTRVREVLGEDHVTFARARGLSGGVVLRRFVLRNAGVQIVTRSGTIFVGLLSGVILVEATYGLDGVGALLLHAIETRDVPVIQGVTLLVAAFIVVVNLLVDLLCLALDPRVQLAPRGMAA